MELPLVSSVYHFWMDFGQLQILAPLGAIFPLSWTQKQKETAPDLVWVYNSEKEQIWGPQTYLRHWLFGEHPIQKLVKKGTG